MTTESKTLEQLLTDQEGVHIPSTSILTPTTSRGSRRTTRPFSAIKERRFRRRFDRCQYIGR